MYMIGSGIERDVILSTVKDFRPLGNGRCQTLKVVQVKHCNCGWEKSHILFNKIPDFYYSFKEFFFEFLIFKA